MKHNNPFRKNLEVQAGIALTLLSLQAAFVPNVHAYSQTSKPSGGVTWTDYRYLSHESGKASADTSASPGNTTAGSKVQRKEILAAAAIEDAAQFYGSGEIKGVLPLILKVLRAANTDQSSLSDEELIDAIVESAQSILDAERLEKR